MQWGFVWCLIATQWGFPGGFGANAMFSGKSEIGVVRKSWVVWGEFGGGGGVLKRLLCRWPCLICWLLPPVECFDALLPPTCSR